MLEVQAQVCFTFAVYMKFKEGEWRVGTDALFMKRRQGVDRWGASVM
jgi:hypothetical protein